MKKIIHPLLLISFCLHLSGQTLVTELEYVDQNITWPWNWDVISDQDRLITVNENGTLNIKINGAWENIEINPNEPEIEPRDVALEEDGTIWFTTTEHGLWSYDTNGELVQYTSANSFLPVDNLRKIAIQNNIFWISTDGMGLIRHDFNTDETTHFTKELYTDLKSDFNLDPFIDKEDNVWFKNRECLSKISPDLEWTNEDMRFHITGGNVNDLHIVSDTEVWIAMNGGLVLFDGAEFNVVIQSQFDNYQQVLKDSKGDLWLSRSSNSNGNGITIIRDGQEYFFSADDNSDIPNQVFEFIEHQDTIIAVGTIGNAISKLVFNLASSVTDPDSELLRVYPNPASDRITLDLTGSLLTTSWSLIDMQGRSVQTGTILPETVDLSLLPSGSYLLNIQTVKGILTKQINVTKR